MIAGGRTIQSWDPLSLPDRAAAVEQINSHGFFAGDQGLAAGTLKILVQPGHLTAFPALDAEICSTF